MTIMWKEILEQPEVLERCINYNEEIIEKIAQKLNQSEINSVVIAARGTSDHAGVYGKYIIEYELGIPVALAAPSIFTSYGRKLNFKNCLVIGISQSGKAADVLEVLKEANRQNATTISITNFLDSPLANEANFHLWCNAGDELSVAATKTFTSELLLLALLVAKWSKNKLMLNDLFNIPKELTNMLKESGSVKDKIIKYKDLNECFVLSRGINYSVVLEAALKIQETTYVRAKAFATSDFHHGPFAMIEENTLVIVYAPNGPCIKDITEMIYKLKNSGAKLIVVSNVEELLKEGDCSFEIPQIYNDIISPFYNVIIAQMFACQLALAKGLNPDEPRGLDKVTITK